MINYVSSLTFTLSGFTIFLTNNNLTKIINRWNFKTPFHDKTFSTETQASQKFQSFKHSILMIGNKQFLDKENFIVKKFNAMKVAI